MARTHTLKAAKGNDKANNAIATAALKNANKADDKAVKPAKEKKHDERFLAISMQTYVNALDSASGFSKSALNLELAVGLSVFANEGKTDLQAKKTLYSIYGEAGYKCASPKDEDYKTVNRRINTAAELFDWLGGKAAIDEITIATSEMQSIQAIVNHLTTEFDFRGINSVLATVGKPVVLKRQKGEADVDQKTGESITTGQKQASGKQAEAGKPSDADQRMADQIGKAVEGRKQQEANQGQTRRETDKEDYYVVKTAHMQVAIPRDVDRDELMQLATELLQLAQTLSVAESA